MPRDFYDVLGLQRGASAEDIKKAYRKLSKELHPDKHKGDKDAEAKFKEVNEAYETLSDPQKKQMYDQFGRTGPGAGGAGGGFGGQGFGGFDFSGFQQGDASAFSDLFEGFFGGGGGRTRQNDRGEDREVEFTIEFADAFSGLQKTISVRKLATCDRCKGNGAEEGSKIVTCDECGGTGQVVHTTQSIFGRLQQRVICPKCRGSGKVPEKSCSKCRGEGRVEETVSIDINIPAGIRDGQTLRLRGEGDAGRQGATPGDLYVHIRVRDDARFERQEDDIYSTLTVSVVDAILGTEAAVPTVHGTVSLKIPEGTQPEQILRLKGKGMPVLNTSRFGDHYVTVKIQIPTKLSRAERKLVEEWKSLQ
jgi:molecular chaperone DnaJ